MKKLLAISLTVLFSATFSAVTIAAEWKLFEKSQLSVNGHPLSIQLVGTHSPGQNTNAATAINQSLLGRSENMAPLTLGQLKLSFIDIAPNTDLAPSVPETHAAPMINFYTGVQAEKFQDLIPTETFSEKTDWSASTFILFFGVNLNAGAGYFQGNAFTSRGPENGIHSKAPAKTGFPQNKLLDTSVKGFNAAAGYKLNNLITLEAGYGYAEQDRDQAKTGDEAWAIYAQAILNLAPGVQMIPEIGQIDYDKNKPKGAAADNFYAGAKWEINF